MTMFPGFSEATKLYVENHALVQEVRAAYDRDVDLVIEALEAAIKARVAPAPFSTYTTQSDYVYWWLGKRGRGRAVTLWFPKRDPETIDHESVVLHVDASAHTAEGIEKIRKAAGAAPCFEAVDGKSRYHALRLEIPFDASNPIPAAADTIATALRVLAEYFPK
jgi:hypothetical protein